MNALSFKKNLLKMLRHLTKNKQKLKIKTYKNNQLKYLLKNSVKLMVNIYTQENNVGT